MATETNKPGVATSAPLSKDAALANILKANEVAISYAGKKGFNPYFYINNVLIPLKAKVEGGDTQSIVVGQSLPMPTEKELRVEVAETPLAPATDAEAAANVSSAKGLARVVPVQQNQ